MRTLQQLRADTGLPIDMLLTLLNEQHLPYNQEEVATWRDKETREGEGIGESKPSPIELREGIEQIIPMESIYSLKEESTNGMQSNLVDYGEMMVNTVEKEGKIGKKEKRGYLVLSPCPFFPSQAGQEGDRGTVMLQNEVMEVVNTVCCGQNERNVMGIDL